MRHVSKFEDPNVSEYVWHGVIDDLHAFKMTIRREWFLIAILVVALGGLVGYFEPMPPSKIRMASGQPDSGLDIIAKKYKAHLALSGVEVELVPSGGSPDNLDLVNKGHADIGLSQSGLEPADNVVYLGSVAYQPFWMFFRGTPPQNDDLAAFLSGKKISVGIKGSGTKFVSDVILSRLNDEGRSKISTVELNNSASLQGLQDGTLDAAFLLATHESRNTKELLAASRIGIYDFGYTKGLAHQLHFLEPVSLTAGIEAFHPARPAKDIHMVAATVTLIAQKTLHPATQLLLLTASKAITADSDDPFRRAQGFPGFVDRKLARSPVAQRFYERGEPMLSGRMPYWIASLFDFLWPFVLTLIAVVLPLVKLIPSYRRITFSALVSRRHYMIRTLELKVASATSIETLQECLAELDELKNYARGIWVPQGSTSDFVALTVAIMQLEHSLKAKMLERHHYVAA